MSHGGNTFDRIRISWIVATTPFGRQSDESFGSDRAACCGSVAAMGAEMVVDDLVNREDRCQLASTNLASSSR